MIQERVQCGVVRLVCLCLAISMSGVLLGCVDSSQSSRVLTVFAASSLTDAFTDLGKGFEAEVPGAEVRFAFAGSQVLRLQIEEGAPADVIASANVSHMNALRGKGLVSQSVVFAQNPLALIIPVDRPSDVGTFADLPRAEKVVLGIRGAPIGEYTHELLSRAEGALGNGFRERVEKSVVSQEKSVRLVRAKVALGEADAAIVYQSDVAGERRVQSVPIPDDLNVSALYPMAGVMKSENKELVSIWFRYMASPQARALLQSHGFKLP